MARMLPERIRADTESRAERVVFDALRDRTGADLLAFHHVAWLVPGDQGARQGEADFVVAHAKHGTAVIEVKGGAISHDGRTDEWRSGPHVIGDPFDQARRSSFVLAESLSRITGTPRGALRIGYGVAFPDVRLRDVDLDPSAPREVILDADDVAAPDAAVRRLLGYFRATPVADRVLESLLAKSFTLPAPLGVRLGREDRELLTLTEQQYEILGQLARHTRIAICGCAGSGKTFLAAEKARRLAAQGFRVLVVCFNRFLARHVRQGLADAAGVDVRAYDELCEVVVRDVDGALPRDPEPYYWQALRARFAEAAASRAGRYDALIVDEAQDIQADWWLPLQLLLKDPDRSPLYVFYDDNQRIFPVPPGLPIAAQPVQLTVNCRNTQRIHGVVTEYYDGGTITARGPEGMPVSVVPYGTRKELLATLDDAVGRWLREGGVRPEDIALLTPHGQDGSVLWWRDTVAGTPYTDDPWQPGAILRSSVFRFKGLERLVVGVVELDGATDQELYVAFSRPSVYLTVFCPASEERRIRGHLARVKGRAR